MFATVVTYYICMKFFLLYSLVRAQVAYEPLQKHFIFLGALFSAGVAFLSYVFIMSPQNAPDWQAWQVWMGKTLGLSILYFWLLAKFDEGIIFWILLLGGVLLVYW